MTNPAATYCKNQGYSYQLKGSSGYCYFGDGTSCEEWSYYNGSCKPGGIAPAPSPAPTPAPNPNPNQDGENLLG
jgi:hypothetical protein